MHPRRDQTEESRSVGPAKVFDSLFLQPTFLAPKNTSASHYCQAAVEAYSATGIWPIGLCNDGRDRDSKSTSTKSGPRSPAKIAATSVYETATDPKPAGLDASTRADLQTITCQGIHTSSLHCRGFGHLEESSTSEHLSHKIKEDAEMEGTDDNFDEDVMIYYNAAISSDRYHMISTALLPLEDRC